ncbi:hypothetical protein BTZ20_4589 [Rhodococcus sp. MTM3W5.2]|nr:hypothetical protein BTZ20_4589 [Rhodococcus sp. MTM3W5.2]
MLDQQRLRRDTPGCLDKVFLDSAGSSLPLSRCSRRSSPT